MAKATNGKRAAALAAMDSPAVARVLRDAALEQCRNDRQHFLRTQFVAWWANLVGEIETVQAELAKEGSHLHDLFTHDERWDMDSALEACWDALAGGRKPKCVPSFLKVQPFFLPLSETAK